MRSAAMLVLLILLWSVGLAAFSGRIVDGSLAVLTAWQAKQAEAAAK